MGDFLLAGELGKKHLVRADGSYVGIESLSEKLVGILFFPFLDLKLLRPLRAAYDRIRRAEGEVFEIVVVALCRRKSEWEKDRELFDEKFKVMSSWLAVPFDELLWRERLWAKHKVQLYYINLHIFDGKGSPLLLNAMDAIFFHGPAAYPFTDARLSSLKCERSKICNPKSWKSLLGSDCRDFLITITPDGKRVLEVPISQLKGEVIVLYLICSSKRFPDKEDEGVVNFLLENRGPDFNIVLINADHMGGYTNEASFLEILSRLPHCLALPFKDERIWALTSILHSHRLAIVGADGDIFIHCKKVIQEYGKEAYPFTMQGAVNAEINRLINMRLHDMLKSLGIHSLFRKEEVEVGGDVKMRHYQLPLLDLLGEKKGVLLYIDHGPPPEKLLELYYKDSSFQVIFLSLNFLSFPQDFYCMPMSWLGIPISVYCDDPCRKDLGFLFPTPGGFVIAFEGSSGNLLGLSSVESFGGNCDDFPYITFEDFHLAVSTYMPMKSGLDSYFASELYGWSR